ncbi:DnaT-like ssDNA-binding protein, partial [Acinetobacter baumannii]|uniref:DnaT-like ssDNA-binding protein n=1 Tax=Acinetobacter baumannii TaxID=470 RepID=UPI001924EF02
RSFPLNPQALSFPRDGVTMFDNEMPAAFMPPQLIGAQVAVIQAITAGVELFPVQSGAAVTEETVGPITTKYDAVTWDASDLPVL